MAQENGSVDFCKSPVRPRKTSKDKKQENYDKQLALDPDMATRSAALFQIIQEFASEWG